MINHRTVRLPQPVGGDPVGGRMRDLRVRPPRNDGLDRRPRQPGSALRSAHASPVGRHRAPVAQWIEQPPPKGQVGRSIRLRGAKPTIILANSSTRICAAPGFMRAGLVELSESDAVGTRVRMRQGPVPQGRNFRPGPHRIAGLPRSQKKWPIRYAHRPFVGVPTGIRRVPRF